MRHKLREQSAKTLEHIQSHSDKKDKEYLQALNAA
jgi:hypothetical protein